MWGSYWFYELHGKLTSCEILLESTHDSPLTNLVIKSSLINISQPFSISIYPNSSSNQFQNGNNSRSRKNKKSCQIYGYWNHIVDKCMMGCALRQVIYPKGNITWANYFSMSKGLYYFPMCNLCIITCRIKVVCKEGQIDHGIQT